MRILVLGGTQFLGRHIVEQALARGHEVTLFHRGKTNPHLFPEQEHVLGDRKESLEPLVGRRFDSVLDTSGYLPRVVQLSAGALSGTAPHYTFISTISVYADQLTRGQDETGTLGALDNPAREDITGETYGPLKVLCEQAVADTFTGRVLVIRPGLIVGPHDPTDRFTYWPVRLARGGTLLAPGPESTPVQLIDVRDLAAWTVAMIEAGHTGVFNATGPAGALSIGEFLAECGKGVGADSGARAEKVEQAKLQWVDGEFLVAEQVGAFTELPLWLPEEAWGMSSMNSVRAVKVGLRFRPLAETARDTLAWHRARVEKAEGAAGDFALKSGLSAEREAKLLESWAGYRAGRPA
jgi:2'-hydroxyisoflavone reductase